MIEAVKKPIELPPRDAMCRGRDRPKPKFPLSAKTEYSALQNAGYSAKTEYYAEYLIFC